jgi:hypothetical protein
MQREHPERLHEGMKTLLFDALADIFPHKNDAQKP